MDYYNILNEQNQDLRKWWMAGLADQLNEAYEEGFRLSSIMSEDELEGLLQNDTLGGIVDGIIKTLGERCVDLTWAMTMQWSPTAKALGNDLAPKILEALKDGLFEGWEATEEEAEF